MQIHWYCGSSLTSPKLMRLACFRISVSPSRSFILRYLGQVGVNSIQAAGQKEASFPTSKQLAPSKLLTFGPLASSAAHQGVQAEASLASQVVAPATCQICAQSHPLVRSPPSGELRSCGQPCRLSPQPHIYVMNPSIMYLTT